MKIYYRCDNGPMTDGSMTIVGRIYKDDVLPATREAQLNGALASHGESPKCEEKHSHTKGCAVPMVDVVRPAMEKYFAEWDATPEDPTPVAMPMKEETVVEDGKAKKVQVEDRDLAAHDVSEAASEVVK